MSFKVIPEYMPYVIEVMKLATEAIELLSRDDGDVTKEDVEAQRAKAKATLKRAERSLDSLSVKLDEYKRSQGGPA